MGVDGQEHGRVRGGRPCDRARSHGWSRTRASTKLGALGRVDSVQGADIQAHGEGRIGWGTCGVAHVGARLQPGTRAVAGMSGYRSCIYFFGGWRWEERRGVYGAFASHFYFGSSRTLAAYVTRALYTAEVRHAATYIYRMWK